MSSDLNPYGTPTESVPSYSLPQQGVSRLRTLIRLTILAVLFLAATYLIALPGLDSSPVSQTKLLSMIPFAPVVILCAFAVPGLGDPMLVGTVLASIGILCVLIGSMNLFRNDLRKQIFAALLFGLLNGVASRICFFIAHSLST